MQPPRSLTHRLPTLALLALATATCDGDATTAPPVVGLAFDVARVELGEGRSASLGIRNTGTAVVGPIQFVPGSVVDAQGVEVGGATPSVPSGSIATLNPGDSRQITAQLTVGSLPPGRYDAELNATVESVTMATVTLGFDVLAVPPGPDVASLMITAGPAQVRQGDLVTYTAETRDEAGALIVDATVDWFLLPTTAGLVRADGSVVAYDPGDVRIVAQSGVFADTISVTVSARNLAGQFKLVGSASPNGRATSDIWVHGTNAYTGTLQIVVNGVVVPGNALMVWDISDPAQPVLTDSVLVDAPRVNDIKVRADGTLAVLTHEQSNDTQNGVTILDLTDPSHPTFVSRFTSGLESGVHNVWIEGNFVYVVVDGPAGDMKVLDVSDPANPTSVASFSKYSSFLHDIYGRDGLLFLSYWDEGLVILDAGHGIRGGTPANPVFVSQVRTSGGQTHNAWYWPASGHVFVGEEDFSSPGIMHVVDVRDLENPVEVATFQVPGQPPHNFWLDEDRGILYAAWYQNGVRALDVSGGLAGELDRQGREITFSRYPGPPGTRTRTWAPQLHGGLVYIADIDRGLFVLQPQF